MKGIYLILLYIKRNCKTKVGKLGGISFKKGCYCYIGSAIGNSVNLENRIRRYKRLSLEKSGNLHWHIDYLLVNKNVEIIGIKTFTNLTMKECDLSRKISNISKFSVKKFGSSDCSCESHLHYLGDSVNLEKLSTITI